MNLASGISIGSTDEERSELFQCHQNVLARGREAGRKHKVAFVDFQVDAQRHAGSRLLVTEMVQREIASDQNDIRCADTVSCKYSIQSSQFNLTSWINKQNQFQLTVEFHKPLPTPPPPPTHQITNKNCPLSQTHFLPPVTLLDVPSPPTPPLRTSPYDRVTTRATHPSSGIETLHQ